MTVCKMQTLPISLLCFVLLFGFLECLREKNHKEKWSLRWQKESMFLRFIYRQQKVELKRDQAVLFGIHEAGSNLKETLQDWRWRSRTCLPMTRWAICHHELMRCKFTRLACFLSKVSHEVMKKAKEYSVLFHIPNTTQYKAQ